MTEPAESSRSLRKAYWSAILSPSLGIALALLCLRQWGSPQPWSRLDVYSGTFLTVGVLLAVAQAASFYRAAFRSRELAAEALGLSYDPGLLRWGTVLSLAQLSVLLDYAHWHLVPALENRVFQGIGLGLLFLAAAWLVWTDAWLTRHFSGQAGTRPLMTQGPFGLVRHPRYAVFLAGQVAIPLVFASIFGWILLPLWTLLFQRRIRREEGHLREQYGAEYDAYARRTARLLPGIY